MLIRPLLPSEPEYIGAPVPVRVRVTAAFATQWRPVPVVERILSAEGARIEVKALVWR